ncbi:hypothetical protein [Bacillus siamensis]|uniref:hypothetical protein n=1 Tax=Bacillus siamensis TaxID=659243 RepID=UPI0022B78AD3|nr:hypothetical protein [Bacillus siamensis]MDU0812043.1 hypothetical protein [Bacillus siamensis]
MGGELSDQNGLDATAEPSSYRAVDAETYFRPSCLPVLNTAIESFFFNPYIDRPWKSIHLPQSLTLAPEKTLLHYFSILREAENLTDEKAGGCGTVGQARIPFPLAYAFFSPACRKKHSYKAFLASFEGIGQTHLIKLNQLEGLRYFVEIETIQGSNQNVTFFAYYHGIVQLEKHNGRFLIERITWYGEDFCVPLTICGSTMQKPALISNLAAGASLLKKGGPSGRMVMSKQLILTGQTAVITVLSIFSSRMVQTC